MRNAQGEPNGILLDAAGDRVFDVAYGLNYFDAHRLQRYVTELEKAGFSMHIHAIGDRAVRESLDAIAYAQSVNGIHEPRHRLTHVEMVKAQDKARFAELDVIADFQLAGATMRLAIFTVFVVRGHRELKTDDRFVSYHRWQRG